MCVGYLAKERRGSYMILLVRDYLFAFYFQCSMCLHTAYEDPICESKVKYRDFMNETERRTRRLLTVCCTVFFRGNWAPVLMTNGDSGGSERHSVVSSRGMNSFTQLATFLLETGAASFRFSFHVKFYQVSWNKSTAATNVPDFQLTKEIEHLLPAEETHNSERSIEIMFERKDVSSVFAYIKLGYGFQNYGWYEFTDGNEFEGFVNAIDGS